MANRNIEQGQSPSTRAVHHRGQNISVALTRPAAPTRSSFLFLFLFFFILQRSLATSGAMIASFFVRPQTTPAARAPRDPIVALQEPAATTRATPVAAASPAAAKVSAVPAQLVAPRAPALQ